MKMENKQEKLKMAEEEGNGDRGGVGGISGGEESLSLSSPTGGERVKLFCSQGGKILPRPTDGSLKYVGGETRVVAIPRSITFSGIHLSLSLSLTHSLSHKLSYENHSYFCFTNVMLSEELGIVELFLGYMIRRVLFFFK